MPWRGHGVNEADMYLALECAEVDALKALPVVSAPGIYKPKNKAKAKLNDWHVKPTLNCTGRCGGKRQPPFHCSEVLPTIGDVLHAARLFIEKEHAECIRLATEAKDTPASAEPPPNLFAFMTKASQQQAYRGAAETALTAAKVAESKAIAARKRAETEAAAAREAVKRQRTGLRAEEQMVVEQQQQLAAAPDAEAGGDDDARWQDYDILQFQRLERKTLNRRAVPIPGRADSSGGSSVALPARGDESRGWRHHWRRGLYGAVQEWAEGSRGAAIHMIAELAKHFDIEEEVGAKLKLGLTQQVHPNPLSSPT